MPLCWGYFGSTWLQDGLADPALGQVRPPQPDLWRTRAPVWRGEGSFWKPVRIMVATWLVLVVVAVLVVMLR